MPISEYQKNLVEEYIIKSPGDTTRQADQRQIKDIVNHLQSSQDFEKLLQFVTEVRSKNITKMRQEAILRFVVLEAVLHFVPLIFGLGVKFFTKSIADTLDPNTNTTGFFSITPPEIISATLGYILIYKALKPTIDEAITKDDIRASLLEQRATFIEGLITSKLDELIPAQSYSQQNF